MKLKRLMAAMTFVAAGAATASALAAVDPALPDYQKASGVSGNLSSVGSDTLANLMTLWAENYKKLYPNINIQIQAAGSSTAPPALTEGTSNLGPMSRKMKDNELQAFEAKHGYKPTAIPVAIDALAATYLMGADSAHSFFISVNIPGKEGLAQLTIKESLVEGWDGAAVARMRIDDVQSRLNGHESMRMASFEASNITLPELGLVHRLMDAATMGEEDMEAAVKTFGPILEEILAADPPIVRQVRANGMVFSVENGSVSIDGAGFDWLSNAPRHTTSFIRNLSAPRNLMQVSTGFLAPALKADMTFESTAQSSSSHKKNLTIKAENLADVDCSLTMYDAGIISTSEQALLLQSFSDLRLTVKDRGAMAWLGLNISPNGLAAATVLHQTLDKGLELNPTQQNRAIREALLTFVQRPGKLEVTSARGQRIGVLQLLAALSDPGMLFTCTATPGPKSLEEQINALAAQAAQTSAPAEAAGK